MKNYFAEKEQYRNYAMVTMGLNTALRISDLLTLTWDSVYHSQHRRFHKHIHVIEQKTGKANFIPINTSIKQALRLYRKQYDSLPSTYLFYNPQTPEQPITRVQAYRIIHRAAQELELEGTIGCHSLRKTFGYQAWKNGAQPALLMSVFNHSSYQITKRYLCIEQDDKDQLFLKTNL